MAALVALTVHADPDRWRAAGFTVDEAGACQVGAVRIVLEPPSDAGRTRVVGWAFDGLTPGVDDIDGIPTGAAATSAPASAGRHPNGVTALDHVVVTTPDLGRTVAALEAAGLRALRERDTEAGGRPMRQVFLRPGEAIIEVVGPREPTGDGKARFFGLAFVVADLDTAGGVLGDDLGQAKTAVQPGRRIATVRTGAGLGVPVALMSPDPG
jgi:hypothetical protein